jgi:hypothetical protein
MGICYFADIFRPPSLAVAGRLGFKILSTDELWKRGFLPHRTIDTILRFIMTTISTVEG